MLLSHHVMPCAYKGTLAALNNMFALPEHGAQLILCAREMPPEIFQNEVFPSIYIWRLAAKYDLGIFEQDPHCCIERVNKCVYISHKAHGALARPVATHKTATRRNTNSEPSGTQFTDQCMPQLMEGRRRNRQTPPTYEQETAVQPSPPH